MADKTLRNFSGALEEAVGAGEELEDTAARQVSGRLLDKATGARLAGFTVRAFDLDAAGEPKDLGYDITSANGLFALAYQTPLDTSRHQSKESQRGRRIS